MQIKRNCKNRCDIIKNGLLYGRRLQIVDKLDFFLKKKKQTNKKVKQNGNIGYTNRSKCIFFFIFNFFSFFFVGFKI